MSYSLRCRRKAARHDARDYNDTNFKDSPNTPQHLSRKAVIPTNRRNSDNDIFSCPDRAAVQEKVSPSGVSQGVVGPGPRCIERGDF